MIVAYEQSAPCSTTHGRQAHVRRHCILLIGWNCRTSSTSVAAVVERGWSPKSSPTSIGVEHRFVDAPLSAGCRTFPHKFSITSRNNGADRDRQSDRAVSGATPALSAFVRLKTGSPYLRTGSIALYSVSSDVDGARLVQRLVCGSIRPLLEC